MKNKGFGFRKVFLIGSLVVLFSTAGLAITLKESINLALVNNPSVQAAQSKLEASSSRVGQAVSAFLPTFRVDASTGKNYTQPSIMQFDMGGVSQSLVVGTSEVYPSKSIQLSVTQPLFTGGKLLTGYDVSRKGWDIANEDFRKAKQEVVFNTISAYLGVLKAKKYVDLANESVDLTGKQVQRIQAMLNNGLVTKADLLRSQVQEANAQVALLQANNSLEIAKNIYNNAVGNDIDTSVEVSDADYSQTLPEKRDDASLQAFAFDNRPDWRQFVANKGIADDAVKMAYSGYMPTVALIGRTGDQITSYSNYTNDVSQWNWNITGSWSLDNFAPPLRVREAAENLDAVKANEETVRRGIILDVRNSIYELKSAEESMPGAKKAVDLAQENYQAAVVRFEAGATTNLEMMDAMISLTEAKYRFTQAQYELEIAKAKINKVCGRDSY